MNWHALWVCLIVIPVTIMWVAAVFDIVFRRSDLIWWQRLCWLAGVLLVPLLGALVYAAISLGRGGSEQADYRDRQDRDRLGLYVGGRPI